MSHLGGKQTFVGATICQPDRIREGGAMRGNSGLSSLLFAVFAILGSSPANSAALGTDAASAHSDLWVTRAGGLARAKHAIEQCLTKARDGPDLPSYSCIRAAYTVCEDEHGTSQRDMNECSALSYEAWNVRIVDTLASFASAKGADTRLGSKAEEAKRQLFQSQRRWIEWNAADCELQAKGTEGGSIRPFTISICLSDHAAVRAIDLQRLVDWWLG